MISYRAFKIADILVLGAMTVHNLRWSIAVQNVPLERMNLFLREGLAELCGRNLLRWSYEPQYGDVSPVVPDKNDESTFRECWFLCFGEEGPNGKIPNAANPSIFLEPTAALREELSNPDYDDYYSKHADDVDDANWGEYDSL